MGRHRSGRFGAARGNALACDDVLLRRHRKIDERESEQGRSAASHGAQWISDICCTLRDDLLLEVRRLAEQRRFDYLLIEGTGISEPLPVAATFSFRDEAGASLSDVARLDTMVTVVDALSLLADYSSRDLLRGVARYLRSANAGRSLGQPDRIC
jgi:hypothetical protein